ncbi:MAG TPA: M23 family metallopeptidase [Candidatus Dormibacteraeota bacterium]|nr:M23 family metallopeptidase [Candidatus Dormibacteraeota bacterium]
MAQAQARALAGGLVGRDAPQRLLVPCRGEVTQGFGPTPYAFELPFVENGVYYAHFHTGVDIAVPIGTQIHAAAAGTVVLATTNVAGGVPVGFGTYVLIAHGGGVYTLYGHLSALSVRAGQRVAAGQVVGLSGTTGNSTGPHLHFEVRYGTRPVDPLPLLG